MDLTFYNSEEELSGADVGAQKGRGHGLRTAGDLHYILHINNIFFHELYIIFMNYAFIVIT